MFNASFFAASRDPLDVEIFAPGQNLTITRQAAKSTLELAQSFAERHGLDLSDHGHRESSSRFKQIDSFGIAGHSQRLLVWASI